MKIKIKELAEKSGYSISTISRALNNSTLINESTRERIQKLALDYGYYSQALNVSTKIQKTKRLIGAVFMDISNPIVSKIVKGIEDYNKSDEYDVIILDSNNDSQKELYNIELLNNLGVDGIINLAVDHESHKRIAVKNYEIPIVYICHKYEIGEVDFVCVDAYEAMYKATEYMINFGHKKVCFIGQYPKIICRKEAFCKAMNDYKIPFSKEDLYECIPNYEEGYRIMESIILKKKNYTGIICANDFIAIGVIDCVNNYGFSIPEDFSVVGFDNVTYSSIGAINLTTVNQPVYDIGKRAVEMIYHKITSGSKTKYYTLFESSLIIRSSCKAINT